jgi:hypothetical protein
LTSYFIRFPYLPKLFSHYKLTCTVLKKDPPNSYQTIESNPHPLEDPISSPKVKGGKVCSLFSPFQLKAFLHSVSSLSSFFLQEGKMRIADGSFKGIVTVAIGVSPRIGLAIANGFAEDGAHVILSSCQQADQDKAAREIQNKGGFR